jgi:O-antigen/teichoic acid export membrane protein
LNHIFSFSRIIDLLDQFRGFLVSGSDPQSLSGRATRSGAWIGGGFVFQRALQLGSNLVLTRLLFPEAFGLMALTSVFVIGLAMFSDLGIKPAIIRDARGSDPVFLNTAWTIQVIRGFVLFFLGSLLAYPISLIYGQPILVPLLVVLSATAAIIGFSSVKMATAERDLNFRAVVYVQTAGQVSTILTMVAFAYIFKSVWALAIGNIVGTLTTVIASHLLLRGHRHKFQLDHESVKSLVNFGKWIFLSTIVTYVGGEGLRAIQGGFTSPKEFGILAIAYTIASIPIELAVKLTSSVGLPALSAAHRTDTATMGKVLHKFRKRLLFLSLILVSLVVLVSEPLIEFLYDQRYHDAGPFVIAIAVTSAISLISAGYNNALLALGKSQTYLWIMTIAAVSRIFGLTVGFKIYGILGMIIGTGIANIAVLLVTWGIMFKLKLVDFKLDLASLLFVFLVSGLSAFVI